MKLNAIMLHTSAALLPGIAALTWFYGAGIIINLIVSVVACALVEACCVYLHRAPQHTAGQAIRDELGNGTALLTGLLIGICLPPSVPIAHICVAALFAIGLAKHAYGGLGKNLFNPAMVGYAVLIIAFPLAMSDWSQQRDFIALLAHKVSPQVIDGISAATPLDRFRNRDAMTVAEFWQTHGDSTVSWRWIGLAFLAGGLYLLQKKIITWQMPVAFLLTTVLLATLFYDGGSSASAGSPYWHLGTGGLLVAAFFIITDPVTSPDSLRGQWLFAALIAVAVFVIRTNGAYPDGIAFAVLLANALTPIINHHSYRGTANVSST